MWTHRCSSKLDGRVQPQRLGAVPYRAVIGYLTYCGRKLHSIRFHLQQLSDAVSISTRIGLHRVGFVSRLIEFLIEILSDMLRLTMIKHSYLLICTKCTVIYIYFYYFSCKTAMNYDVAETQLK